MWLGDLIYGPVPERLYRIDLDTVREIGRAMLTSSPGSLLQYRVISQELGIDRVVEDAELDGLSAADLQRVVVDVVNAPMPGIYDGPILRAWLTRARWGFDAFAPIEQEDYDRIYAEVNRILRDSGRPLVKLRKAWWIRILAWIPFAVLLLSWIALERSVRLPVPAHLAGWAAVVLGAFASITPYRSAVMKAATSAAPSGSGHLVISETRRETAARRADNRMNIKVAVYSAGLTLLVSVIAGAILFTLGIGRN